LHDHRTILAMGGQLGPQSRRRGPSKPYDQVPFLERKGCDEMQGAYYVSKPLPRKMRAA